MFLQTSENLVELMQRYRMVHCAEISYRLKPLICERVHLNFPLRLLKYQMILQTVSLNVGRGGALVDTMTFNRRVVGSTPALAAT